MKPYTVKELIDEINETITNFTQNVKFEKLLQVKRVLIVRSVREAVFKGFLEFLKNKQFAGELCIIGRPSDAELLAEYKELNAKLYTVADGEAYSVENTNAYMEQLKMKDIDCTMFFVQDKVTARYSNVLSVVKQAEVSCYAVSEELELMKLQGIDQFLDALALYNALCNWLGK